MLTTTLRHHLVSVSSAPRAVADPGFAKGGEHGERAEREPKRGSGGSVWGRSPQRGPGAEPLVGGQGGEAPLKLKTFCTFLHKKWPKVKDLSENLPPCLSRAAMASPKFWSMGGAAAMTAHSWIRHWSAVIFSQVWPPSSKCRQQQRRSRYRLVGFATLLTETFARVVLFFSP